MTVKGEKWGISGRMSCCAAVPPIRPGFDFGAVESHASFCKL